MLAFRDVTRRYGASRALDGVTFDVPRGVLAAVAGPNGAGKSTLLRLAATLEAPTSGRVLVGGVDPAEDGEAARRRLAWLGPEPGLYGDLTVRENLRLVARLHGTEADLEDAARSFGAGPALDERAGRLSRGLRQRAALARAALGGEVMLLDEPTTGLDDEAAARAVDALLALRGARTVVAATHDARLLARADVALRLRAGRLEAA